MSEIESKTTGSDLDELAHEVHLRLVHADLEELVEDPNGSLFRLAANVTAEWSGRAVGKTAQEVERLADSDSGDSTHADAAGLQTDEELATLMLTLPPEEFNLLRMQFFDGLTHAQIAARIGATEQTVKRKLANAYRRLRQALQVRR